MNIVYVSDNNFADVMGVSITSLFENNKNCEEINVFIIDNNISEINKNKLHTLAIKYNRNINFILFPDLNELISVEINVKRWALAAFGRLFLELLLPENIDKVLYIDCDTIVRNSINDLYETDLEDYYLGAVEVLPYIYNRILGLQPTDKGHNSGVLLISLNKWREQGLHKKFVEFIQIHNGDVPFVDEGVINGTIHSHIMELPPKYNVYYPFFVFKSSKKYRHHNKHNSICNDYYDDDTFKSAQNNPTIVHFINTNYYFRPWIKPCFGCKMYPYTDEWLKYKAISLWSEDSFHKNKGLLKKQILQEIKYVIVEIYNFVLDLLPKKVSSQISNFVIKNYYMKRF